MAPRIVAVQSATSWPQSSHFASIIRRPTLALARAKHVISALYFGLTAGVYFLSTSEEQHSVHAYAPRSTTAINVTLALLHLYGFGRTCGYFDRVAPRLCLSMPHLAILRRLSLPGAARLPLFHTTDVLCQSYQAYHLSQYMVQRVLAFVFTVVMSFYCLVTPWLLFARRSAVRQSAVLAVNSLLGFFLSVGFPLCTCLLQIVRLILKRDLQKHDKFVTTTLLLGRHLVVTSLGDLISKTIIQLSSYYALRRLVASVGTVESTVQSTMALSTKEPPTRQATAAGRILTDRFHPRRLLVLFVVANVAWGVGLIALTTAATFFRTECPATCALDVAPWFDSTCHCAYVEINCATAGIPGDTIDNLLQPDVIGTSVFFIDVRRCALAHGIALSTLARFHQLHAVFIYFSNMTDWPMDAADRAMTFPSSMTALHIRGSNLKELPPLLMQIPPSLVYLRVQDSPITTVPDAFIDAWTARLSSLTLSTLQLTSLSPKLIWMAHIALLDFRGNNISTLPVHWTAANTSDAVTTLNSLTTIDLSANAITDGPWALVDDDAVEIDLSSNPIAAVPNIMAWETLAQRVVVLDDTPFCTDARGTFCQTKCSRLCLASMIGNYRCDWECYTAACDFDGGDCDAFGF